MTAPAGRERDGERLERYRERLERDRIGGNKRQKERENVNERHRAEREREIEEGGRETEVPEVLS